MILLNKLRRGREVTRSRIGRIRELEGGRERGRQRKRKRGRERGREREREREREDREK